MAHAAVYHQILKLLPELHPEIRTSSAAGHLDWVNRGRIPSLDGLRAVSISMVLACHIGFAYSDRLPDRLDRLLVRGGLGVDVFFVISGLLITLLLLREREANGRISLMSFYMRRAFRILPAYLCFALALPIFVRLGVGGQTQLSLADWVSIPTFLADFLPRRPLVMAHLWSLSVEEHFYLVFPALLWWDRRWAARLTAMWIVVTPAIRYVALHVHILPVPDVKFWTFTRADTIAVGCLLAFGVTSPKWRQWLAWPRGISTAAAVIAMVFLGATPFLPNSRALTIYESLLSGTVDAACVATIVWVCVLHSDSIVGRILNWQPVGALGILSYGIYLWQQPLLIDPTLAPLWIRILLLAAVVALSYFAIERPALMIKARLALNARSRPASTHQLNQLSSINKNV